MVDHFPLLDGGTRMLHIAAIPVGAALALVGLLLVRRKLNTDDDGTRGPGSVSWPVTLAFAAGLCALGLGLLALPFGSPRSVDVSSETIEVRFLWPSPGVPRATPDVEHVRLVESCEVVRSGWRTRSLVEITFHAGGPIEPLEAPREVLVHLAERVAAAAGVPPEYEVRSAPLARDACVTESPW